MTWLDTKVRLKQALTAFSVKTFVSFWLLGLINNVLYVIILSAALDIVGPRIPKGVVLLADVGPSFLVKLLAPYFIHRVPYGVRVVIFAVLSCIGMLLIALTPMNTDSSSVSIKLLGVALASLSSGGGELSFLGLTSFYGHLSLAAWGSGTGGAGLVGAGAYVLATTTFRLEPRSSLLAFAGLPVIMLLSYFVILPSPTIVTAPVYQAIPDDAQMEHDENEGAALEVDAVVLKPAASTLQENLVRARGLFIPYMLPLLLVYIAEYTINQGVAPTLLFPLSQTPFARFRDFYPTYNAIYQAGVFISRSSTPFVRLHNLYLPSILQVANLTLLTLHAMFDFLPSVWIIFVIVFWEGLLGGAVYVNTFAEITDQVPPDEREFSLAATTVSDSGGICIAALLSMGFEKVLCGWQVRHGRDYCTQT